MQKVSDSPPDLLYINLTTYLNLSPAFMENFQLAVYGTLFQRWGQPGQQQGRRFPSTSSVRVLSILWLLVSGFLAEVTQQIHSLRASGVMSFHAASAAGPARAFFRSAGSLCTAFPVKVLLFGFFILCRFSRVLFLGCPGLTSF